MRIGIIGSPSGWYWQDLQRAAASLVEPTLELVPLPFGSLSAGVSRAQPWIGSQGIPLCQLDGVLVRSMPPGSLEQIVFRMDLLHELMGQGCVVINTPRALETAIDKYLTLARLQAAGFEIPSTVVAQDEATALHAFHQLGGDVVIKPIFGSEGRGMMHVTDGELARRSFRALAQIHAVLYVQEFIPHAGADWRLLTIGDEVLGIRRICEHDWRANLAQGARPEPMDVDPSLAETARRAARTIGAEIAAVDIVPGSDGTNYLLEVNAVPGWRGLSHTLQVDVARKVLLHLTQRVRERTDRSSFPYPERAAAPAAPCPLSPPRPAS